MAASDATDSPAGRLQPAPRPPPRMLNRRPRRRHPSTSPARAAWPTGWPATASRSPSRPTRPGACTWSAATSRAACRSSSASSSARWASSATPSASTSAACTSCGASRTCCVPNEVIHQQFDKCYVPRNAQTIGDLDIHELGIRKNGKVVFVNTKYSCLAELEPDPQLQGDLEAGLHQQAGARGPLPPQRPGHGRRRAEVRHRGVQERHRRRLARPPPRRRRA